MQKAPALVGSLILALGAGLHFTGLPLVQKEALGIESPFLKAVIEPVWLFPVIHWAAFALIALLVTVRPSQNSRLILFLIALSVIIDATLTSMKLGPFIGAIMLGLAGVLFLLSSIALRLPVTAD